MDLRDPMLRWTLGPGLFFLGAALSYIGTQIMNPNAF